MTTEVKNKPSTNTIQHMKITAAALSTTSSSKRKSSSTWSYTQGPLGSRWQKCTASWLTLCRSMHLSPWASWPLALSLKSWVPPRWWQSLALMEPWFGPSPPVSQHSEPLRNFICGSPWCGGRVDGRWTIMKNEQLENDN